jgi:hypothetical protein
MRLTKKKVRKGAAGGPKTRVDNDNHFASFFAEKRPQTIIIFRKKIM